MKKDGHTALITQKQWNAKLRELRLANERISELERLRAEFKREVTQEPRVDADLQAIYIPLPSHLHPDTAELVKTFAWRLAIKLRKAEQKYGYSNGWKESGWMDECRAKLVEHVHKGDPLDVAAYCAFLMWHGEHTRPAPAQPVDQQPGMVSVPIDLLKAWWNLTSREPRTVCVAREINKVLAASQEQPGMVRVPMATLKHWRTLVDDNPQDLAPRMEAYINGQVDATCS